MEFVWFLHWELNPAVLYMTLCGQRTATVTCSRLPSGAPADGLRQCSAVHTMLPLHCPPSPRCDIICAVAPPPGDVVNVTIICYDLETIEVTWDPTIHSGTNLSLDFR